MQVKRFVITATVAGGFGAGLFLGAGQAAADPNWWVPAPPPPGHIGQIVNVPPGHVGQWVGVPPGHWDKPWKWVK
ncbi:MULTISPECIES: hypothetical protein [Mycolicibacterium]|jgi:hypothetical protein|uniref:Uncharacterized protein n=1 Tax=Mycolicibacterium austroafricanum TaxID=39687 RepID=A0ABT8HL90_MYCAO|nr:MULTISPECIES: hypothetical protein [Mycolicibacterium]MCV7127038.1 hypothetical protein [Mycolicibacterium vanbaalenii PYR-1]MDN4521520.1 hypothetical protein [Mycolicibacterium austroafricanum]MDW5610644.1 hypothetical protein [Mycolicibacterium sp. D5.8-2]PQP47089.1 hypothetical protein C6A88_16670 [Mycolicibacterium austroafricanum]QRZ05468.1 hypothetical protein JN090_21340 [Mycolicibacterium austroafricanum]